MEETTLEEEKINIETEDVKEIMQERKNILTTCLKKISSYIDELKETEKIENVFSMLEKVKKALDAVQRNIDLLNEEKIDYKKISENEIIINEFFRYYINFCCLDMEKENPDKPKEEVKESEAKPETEKKEIKDSNILIISEMQNKVILPYTVEKINKILGKRKNKYCSMQEVIDGEFTIPLERYKNPAIARFREAFNLMRNKERANLYKSLDLGLELMWNTLLNPAIITACNNLDELDIYLDYLDSNEIEKFKIFDVKYEIAPIIKK